MRQLQRLFLDYRSGELIVRALCRTENGPGPNTEARTREVSGLVIAGLQDALEALEGRVDMVGTSGYDVREDIMLATTSPAEAKRV